MDSDSDELTAAITAQVEEWSSNSNECFTIELVRSDGSQAATFQPEFTYPIFGEQESIFGYRDLAITLKFAAHDLRPQLSVIYSEKFKELGEVKPTDIEEALKEFLPEEAFGDQTSEDAVLNGNGAEFKPPGERIHSYSRDGKRYEVWCASLANEAAKQLLENMEILVPMFIEGGTMLQLEQDWTTQRWKLFLLYEISPTTSADCSPYCLIGYATSYRVFTFPDRQKPLQSDLDMLIPTTQSVLDFLPPPELDPNEFAPTAMPGNISSPLDLPSRERLSQFLIFPPWQNAGHGQELYNKIYTHLTKPSNIREFTVEDPNEAFDDLRDHCDLVYLRSHVPEFTALRINTNLPADKLRPDTHIPTDLIVPLETRELIRAKTKLMPRQLDRLVEMHTLSFIPPISRSRNRITRKEKTSGENDKAYFFWRLYVKQRLYVFNRDQLVQLERAERVERLEATVDSVVEGYVKCLERVERREKAGAAAGVGVAGGETVEGATAPKGRLGKRRVIEEDEEDAEDSKMQEAVKEKIVAVNGHKKARME